jgi:hypothetical protein
VTKIVPPGTAKGVELRRLHHAELPWQVGALGLRREPAADAVHVALQVLVFRERRGAEQARGHVLADLDLLGLGDVGRRLDHVLGGVDQLVDVEAIEIELRIRGSGAEQQPPESWLSLGVLHALRP